MIDKLQNIILHYEELEQQMIDPALINNQNKYKEVTREHRRLAPVLIKQKTISQFLSKLKKANLF